MLSLYEKLIYVCQLPVSAVIPSIFSLIFWYCLWIVCWIFQKHYLSFHCPPFPFANHIFIKDQHVSKQHSESRLNNLTLSLISSKKKVMICDQKQINIRLAKFIYQGFQKRNIHSNNSDKTVLLNKCLKLIRNCKS